MSGSETAKGGQRRAPAGLLEKLMAAVRPEFRAEVLVFDPADPVFGGDACRVPQCGRTARTVGMCYGHHLRWVHAGRPDPGAFAVSEDTAVPWFGHAPLAGCKVPGCGFGSDRRRLCPRHLRAWQRAGEPDGDGWLAGLPPAGAGDKLAQIDRRSQVQATVSLGMPGLPDAAAPRKERS